jgi:hypothetical protein
MGMKMAITKEFWATHKEEMKRKIAEGWTKRKAKKESNEIKERM